MSGDGQFSPLRVRDGSRRRFETGSCAAGRRVQSGCHSIQRGNEMNAVVDQTIPSEALQSQCSCKSSSKGITNQLRRDGRASSISRRFVRAIVVSVYSALERVSRSVISTILAAALLTFTFAFATVMVVAILVVLTCGLACYA